MPDDHLSRAAPSRDPELVREALRGLLTEPKTLPAKLFYDEEGCRLFYRITELPEYYLTRTEMALLRALAPLVAASIPVPAALIEYGASDETKAALLLKQVRAGRQGVFAAYVPIDVAAPALRAMRRRLMAARPGLLVLPITADFLRPLRLPREIAGMSRLGFFPGSTIGNLDPPEARTFLAEARRALGAGSHMLIGVDLRKDAARLIAAYDDSAGVTAAFNRNMLVRLNREAAADFDLDGFDHRAVWNDEEGRIEMHLVSRRDQVVHLGGTPIRFERGETIHTENSYKYTPEGFRSLVEQAGWRPAKTWTDRERLFAVCLLAC
jgi:L-histidine N-alpha-methyltransferase